MGTNGREYKVKYYNLDAIIAVGYRINSKAATQFRIWATRVLHDYLVNGYAINRYRLDKAPEAVEGLNKAIAFIESEDYPGALKGKITIKLSKDMLPKANKINRSIKNPPTLGAMAGREKVIARDQ